MHMLRKLLADDTKFKIIKFLLDCTCCDCICHVQEKIKKDHSVIVKDIKQLEKAGLVWTKKDGKFLRCGIVDKPKIKRLIELMEEIEDGKKERIFV